MRSLMIVAWLTACLHCGGSSHKTFHVHDDILEDASEAQARINALLGCEVISLAADTETATLNNGVTEIFFSTGMLAAFDGLTLTNGGETDIMIRPKPEIDATAQRHGALPPDYIGKIIHELGHAYGLEHVPTADIMNIDGGDWHNSEVMSRFGAALSRAGVRCDDKLSAQ